MSLLLLLSAAAANPSFDCAAATRPAERLVCADAELAVRDRALQLVYERGGRPFGFPRAYVAHQRRWLEARNRCRTAECVRRAYDRRLADLSGGARLDESFRHESYVGSLGLSPLGDGWHVFDVGTAAFDRRGRARLASASGVVRMENGIGRWQAEDGCALELRRTGARWRVAESPECARRFAGLSLAGTYMTEADWWATDGR